MNLLARVSDEHLQAYASRALTPKALSVIYEVTPRYVRSTLPKRQKQVSHISQKRSLAKARKEFRLALARQVDENRLTVPQASKLANCSQRHMWRYLNAYRSTYRNPPQNA